jgi:hypothetical protein
MSYPYIYIYIFNISISISISSISIHIIYIYIHVYNYILCCLLDCVTIVIQKHLLNTEVTSEFSLCFGSSPLVISRGIPMVFHGVDVARQLGQMRMKNDENV